MKEPAFDIAEAHNWFARDLNNSVWTWLDEVRGGDSTDPIVHAVHASYYHWEQVGSTINLARAGVLVANVHAALRSGPLALGFAKQSLELLSDAGDDAQDWDWAFSHDALARAMAAAGDSGAAEQRRLARQFGDDITDKNERDVFDAWFAINHDGP